MAGVEDVGQQRQIASVTQICRGPGRDLYGQLTRRVLLVVYNRGQMARVILVQHIASASKGPRRQFLGLSLASIERNVLSVLLSWATN